MRLCLLDNATTLVSIVQHLINVSAKHFPGQKGLSFTLLYEVHQESYKAVYITARVWPNLAALANRALQLEGVLSTSYL